MDPLQAGMLNALKFSSGLQDLRAQETARPFLEPSLQEQLRQAQLANALKQNEVNFAPQMSKARLALEQAQAPHMNASTQSLLQSIADQKRKSQLEQENPLLGQTGAAGQIGALMFLKKLRDAGAKNGPTMAEMQPTEQPNISDFSSRLNQFINPQDQQIASAAQQQTDIGQQEAPMQQIFKQALQQQPNIVTQPKSPQRPQTDEDNYINLLEQSIKNKLNPGGIYGNRGGSAGQKEIAGLQQQLSQDHPDWDPQKVNEAASAYLSGNKVLSDGTQLERPSGLTQTLISQIQKRVSTAQIQNQYAQADMLAKDIENIDIKPLQAFTGIKGKTRFALESKNMIQGKPVSEEFRDYLAFKDNVSKLDMDSIRKSLNTSVVPEYVFKTLAQAADPSSRWWNDPEQVKREWETTLKWVRRNRDELKKKSTGQDSDYEELPQSKDQKNRLQDKFSNTPMTVETNSNDPLGIR